MKKHTTQNGALTALTITPTEESPQRQSSYVSSVRDTAQPEIKHKWPLHTQRPRGYIQYYGR